MISWTPGPTEQAAWAPGPAEDIATLRLLGSAATRRSAADDAKAAAAAMSMSLGKGLGKGKGHGKGSADSAMGVASLPSSTPGLTEDTATEDAATLRLLGSIVVSWSAADDAKAATAAACSVKSASQKK